MEVKGSCKYTWMISHIKASVRNNDAEGERKNR